MYIVAFSDIFGKIKRCKVEQEVNVKFRRIKDLREDHDMYQKDVAQLLGISQQYYSEYESGKRTIPIQHLITLAKYYHTSLDYLVGLTDDDTSKNSKTG